MTIIISILVLKIKNIYLLTDFKLLKITYLPHFLQLEILNFFYKMAQCIMPFFEVFSSYTSCFSISSFIYIYIRKKIPDYNYTNQLSKINLFKLNN